MFNYLSVIKKEETKFALGVLLVLLVFLGASLLHINAPFNHVTADSNGFFGLAAKNLAQKGVWHLKFGLYPEIIEPGDILQGKFYANHPDGFIFLTVALYKIFGVSEATTRLGPLIMMLLALGLFAYALRKIFHSNFEAWLSSLILAILPGFIFYGETLEVASVALAAALVCFSLFVLCFPEQKRTSSLLFYLSIFIGGLFGWFFYFMPLSIWFFILFSKIPRKVKPLILMPLVVLVTVIVTIAHFSWQNGNVIGGLVNAAAFRAQGIPQKIWLAKIFSMLALHANFIFLTLAANGLIIFLAQLQKKISWRYFLPLLFFPFLICLGFRQWVMHPFGVIYFLPIIAVFSSISLSSLLRIFSLIPVRFSRAAGIAVVAVIFIAGAYFSYANLDYFFNRFLILDRGDIQLFQKLSSVKDLQDNNICLGLNNLHINMIPIAEWYLGKKVSCDQADKITTVLIYNTRLDETMGGYFYAKEQKKYEDLNFKVGSCSGFLCSMAR
jgi:4-amino-4-deoxy-L-arabinose transferase-like glycosyltransferase